MYYLSHTENFFFFQEEDGIRDIGVTGVQTCALPISVQPAFWSRFCWMSHNTTQGTALFHCSALMEVGSFHPTRHTPLARRTTARLRFVLYRCGGDQQLIPPGPSHGKRRHGFFEGHGSRRS